MSTATRLLTIPLLITSALAAVRAGDDDPRAPFLVRLDADPADAEALLGLSDLHEEAGRRRHARRYLRAFLRLVYRNPRRVEAARRLAALRPANPFEVHEDGRDEGGYVIYRNEIDRALAVRVPEGPYLRHLRLEDATAVVEIDLPAYVIDLHETTNAAHHWFLLEGGFEVPEYWSEDGLEWLAEEAKRWIHLRTLAGRVRRPDHPMWGPTFFEARAHARWAAKRIPTEAEWEKAARGGITLGEDEHGHPNPFPARPHPWGDAPVCGPDGTWRANLGDFVPRDDAHDVDRSLPVDSLLTGGSPYGCLHMAGNVTEWNADRWISDSERLALPRRSPFAAEPGTEKGDEFVRAVRGGYFNSHDTDARVDRREPRTFGSSSMTFLFKAGLRCAADDPRHLRPDEPAEPNEEVGPLADEPDPLDAVRLYETAIAAEEDGDRARAWRFARAAVRLVRSGPIRIRLVDHVRDLRPTDPWIREGEGWRNLIDGKVAVRAAGLLADRHEVTEGDMVRFAAEGGYEVAEYWSEAGLAWLGAYHDPRPVPPARRTGGGGVPVNAARYGAGDLPVTYVSFFEAQAYARWARKRVPTIDEWLRLAGRGERPYPWGYPAPTEKKPRAACHENRAEGLHSLEDPRAPVGSHPEGATPERLLDLYGNVAEWVAGRPGDEWPSLVGGSAWASFEEFDEPPREEHSPDATGWTSGMGTGFRCVAD